MTAQAPEEVQAVEAQMVVGVVVGSGQPPPVLLVEELDRPQCCRTVQTYIASEGSVASGAAPMKSGLHRIGEPEERCLSLDWAKQERLGEPSLVRATNPGSMGKGVERTEPSIQTRSSEGRSAGSAIGARTQVGVLIEADYPQH